MIVTTATAKMLAGHAHQNRLFQFLPGTTQTKSATGKYAGMKLFAQPGQDPINHDQNLPRAWSRTKMPWRCPAKTGKRFGGGVCELLYWRRVSIPALRAGQVRDIDMDDTAGAEN